ncbi:NADPH-dependent glutamate synthase beta subunit-like oxidoreductase/ferredoxin [Litorivivens lipolytica]|uniref:NADPH-dependent glutamate synthase beta subunit-like oxidoreductase/ferredoxin n=1 Tax=Litorivivens lipolytica TaxID=1524264 RepID=A0A7W4W2G9_9GAMM|nr:FAD-dependent oxidoreductase [Litorivivens lipolytica]MBB3046223.1 NADPH-dependent glutamate synthase beta subunit-like oxidoreductase/ferredoxin [Litorivivens lipolytica]
MKPTDVKDPEYFHKVVDCQYACPAHTPVPEYIRLIAAQRYTDAYMINWESNVFPGVLGRTCDRPCEPACRRSRIEEEPVAICRLKRVAADNKSNVADRLPAIPKEKNGKKIALLGGGPASLTVARDLMPLGYSIDLYDDQPAGGGFMRSQIPAFRLPEEVLNEEVNMILDMGVLTQFNTYVDSLKSILDKGYDAVFVGTGAPRGRDLDLPGRKEADDNIHIGIDWLSSVAFGHTSTVGKRVVVMGGGNTAMDCCRTARRLGGEDVKVVVRSPFDDMKASPWEKEDAMHEGIPILDNHVPQEFVVENGKLKGVVFEKVEAQYDDKGKRTLVPTGEDSVLIECDDVLMAIGQENAFPWIERDIGVEFGKWDMPVVNEVTFQSSNPKVFFGGDAAFGPENVITAVAHGHQAAISIDLFCRGESVDTRPAPGVNLVSQKMGIHEWSYDNAVEDDKRYIVPQAELKQTLSDRKLEVELGFDAQTAFREAQRCLNCDVQTVFAEDRCIECDACIDICPTDCLTFEVNDGEEEQIRQKLKMPANNLAQDLYVSEDLPTGRAMIKDENVCLHCGLCAERCPTAAWDMQKFYYSVTKAGK